MSIGLKLFAHFLKRELGQQKRRYLVLLLGGGGCVGGDGGFGDNLEGLHHGDVTQSLGDAQGRLAVLGAEDRVTGTQQELLKCFTFLTIFEI